MGVSVGGCLKQNMASRRQTKRKREKLAVGPESRECKAGYKTHKCKEPRHDQRSFPSKSSHGHFSRRYLLTQSLDEGDLSWEMLHNLMVVAIRV